jgi:hypothetical protein
VTLERQTEKVLRVAEALLQQPLGALIPGPGELAGWDLRARLEGVLARALQQTGAASAEAAPPAEPAPEGVRVPGSRPAPRSAASASSQAAPLSPAAAFAGLFGEPTRHAPQEAPVQWPGAPERSSQARAAERTSVRGSAPEGWLEAEGRARAAAWPSPFPQSETVARSLGLAPIPTPGAPALGAPGPTVVSRAGAARPLALQPSLGSPAERVMQAPPAWATPSTRATPPAPSLPPLSEQAVFSEGPGPVRDGGAPASRALRMVSTPTELAALLQSHVHAPEGTPAAPAGRGAAPEAVASPAPGPAHPGPGALVVSMPEPVSLPEVSFSGLAREGEPGGAAEELLLDKLLDRLQGRLREESIRRFGLSGGDI